MDLWMGVTDDAGGEATLTRHGYSDPDNTINALRSLREGRLYHAHSNVGRERLDRLMPMFIGEAVQYPDPDTTLFRIIQFIEGIGRRSAYLVLLIENPLALTQLVRLMAASSWISSWIRQHPLLLDELLDPITTSLESSGEEMTEELGQRLSHVDADDLERQMDVLREVRHGQYLRVAAADVSGMIDWVDVGQRLSMIAEIILGQSANLCIAGLGTSIGTPSAEDDANSPTLGVVAYGKLGSRELGYNSDLDIVFLHHGARAGGATVDGARSIDNTQYYMRLVQRVVHVLTTRTAAGVLYEVDMRLRPSGRSGPVVTSLDGFLNYQKNNAWTWEHQALVRARMVIGPESLRTRFDEIRREIICQPRDEEELQREIREMRTRMSSAHDSSEDQLFDLKHGEGGIVDIEFIVQYFVLRWACEKPEITLARDNIALIRTFVAAGLMPEAEGGALADAYYSYLTAEHQAKLTEQPARLPTGDFKEHREHVKMLWKRLFD
jgi:glutamate-ammonia-ligase adenylyltransferase